MSCKTIEHATCNEAGEQQVRITELEVALTYISDWVGRYASKDHPIKTVADRVLGKEKHNAKTKSS